MTAPLVPQALYAATIARLSGRSLPAVYRALRDGSLPGRSPAEVSAWVGYPITADRYLAAERQRDDAKARNAARMRRKRNGVENEDPDQSSTAAR